MLGNFSIGDYFKQGAVELAWELSLEGFGFEPERHLDHGLRGRRGARPRPRRGGDRGLGGGRRAARADRPVPALGELLAGRPDRAVRAVLRALPRPRPRVRASPTTCRAARTSASSSTGTSSSCSSTRSRSNTLTPLPAQNIDTGLGLNRMAVIQQGSTSVFETDQFQPLIELGERAQRQALRRGLRGRPRAARSWPTTRAAMTFLVADGVVPSNEDRGYVLRRDHAPRDPAGPLARASSPASCRATPTRDAS